MVTIETKTSKDFLAAYNAHDVEKIISFYTEDCIFQNIGTGTVSHGRAELRKTMQNEFTAFPDANLEFKSEYRAGDWLATELVMAATHSANLPGMPATCKKFSIKGVSIIQFRQDKVNRETLYWNLASILQQGGLMPAMPSK